MQGTSVKIELNGRVLCTAGTSGAPGVLTVTVNQIVTVKPSDENCLESTNLETQHSLLIGGLVEGSHVQWMREPVVLHADDLVGIRIVEGLEPDKPVTRWEESSAESRREQRYQLFLQLEEEFRRGDS